MVVYVMVTMIDFVKTVYVEMEVHAMMMVVVTVHRIITVPIVLKHAHQKNVTFSPRHVPISKYTVLTIIQSLVRLNDLIARPCILTQNAMTPDPCTVISVEEVHSDITAVVVRGVEIMIKKRQHV